MSANRIERIRAAACVTLAILLVSPAAAAAQQANSKPNDGSLVASGAKVYGTMCGNCHNARSPLERSDRQWVIIVNHMRVRANLTGGEVRGVLAFLQATNGDPNVAALVGLPYAVKVGPVSNDPAVIANGKLLAEQKACVGCHVIDGAGGQVGPSLNGTIERKGVDFVRSKLQDPSVDNATSMMPNFQLTTDEIEAIVAYLATLQGK